MKIVIRYTLKLALRVWDAILYADYYVSDNKKFKL